MKVIPKFQNKGKLPQIKIGNKWVDLESKGNGEFTARGRSYIIKSDIGIYANQWVDTVEKQLSVMLFKVFIYIYILRLSTSRVR